MGPGREHVTILIVDDDHGHCELVRRNLRRVGINNPIELIHSGDDALDFMFRRGRHAGRTEAREMLVLLDINMPGSLNGLDVLKQIKADPQTRRVPVIMLTTTDDPKEVNRCYELGCSVYITKPVAPMTFIEAVNRLGLFLSVIRLPTADDGAASS
jgi:CheY-like chemotaxis protein